MTDHYVIQLTNNGRCISRNRWHIKLTTVTADTFVQHPSKKLSNKITDPLAEILNNIISNPALYTTEQATSTNNICHKYEEQNTTTHVQKEADIEQYHKRQRIVRKKEEQTYMQTVIEYKKMKSLGQDLDALSKNQTDLHIHNNPTGMSASTEKSYS